MTIDQLPSSSLPGPDCGRFAHQLPFFDSLELDEAEDAEMRAHVVNCRWCTGQIETYRRLNAALSRRYAAPDPAYRPLSFEQIAGLAASETPAQSGSLARLRPLRTVRLPWVEREVIPDYPPTAIPSRGLGPYVALLLILSLAGMIFVLHGGIGSLFGSHSREVVTPTCAATSGAKSICQYHLPASVQHLGDITVGADGTVWFLTSSPAQVGRISPTGALTFFALPTTQSDLSSITIGPGGDLWFTEDNMNRIGRMTASGKVTEYAVPTAHSWPSDLTVGPDGAIWFTEQLARKIGRVTTEGAFIEYPTGDASASPNASPNAIVAGPDGNLWFGLTGDTTDALGRMTPAGDLTVYPLGEKGHEISSVVAGSDGALWFCESAASKIGRMTTSGVVTEIALPTPRSFPMAIAAAPDGALWFTEQGSNQIGRLTTAGALQEYPDSIDNSGLLAIAVAADGSVWFTQLGSNVIGHLT
jgi:virginiamycin B lyase